MPCRLNRESSCLIPASSRPTPASSQLDPTSSWLHHETILSAPSILGPEHIILSPLLWCANCTICKVLREAWACRHQFQGRVYWLLYTMPHVSRIIVSIARETSPSRNFLLLSTWPVTEKSLFTGLVEGVPGSTWRASSATPEWENRQTSFHLGRRSGDTGASS